MKKISILLALAMLISSMGSLLTVNAKSNVSDTVLFADFEGGSDIFDEWKNDYRTSTLDEEHGKSYSVYKYERSAEWKKDFEDVTSGKMIFSFDSYYEGRNTQFKDIFDIYIKNNWNSNTVYRIFMGQREDYVKNGVAMPNVMGLVTGEASYVSEDGCPAAEFGKWMHIDIVVDIDGDGQKSGFEFYVNGEKKMTKTLGWKIHSVNSLHFRLENDGTKWQEGCGTHYIDNFKVATNNSANLDIQPEFNEGYTDLVFSQTVKNLDSFTADDILMMQNWENVSVSAVKNIDYNKLRIYHEGRISDSDIYSIKLNKSVESIMGKKPLLSTITNESTTINEGKMPKEFLVNSDFENKDEILATFSPTKNINISSVDDEHGNSLYSYRYIAGAEWGKTFQEPIDSGRAIFSFDIWMGETNTQFHDTFKLKVDGNGKTNWDYVFFIARREDYKKPRAFGFTTGAGDYDVMEPMPTYEYDRWQHVDLVVNIDDGSGKTKFDMYVDGEYKMSREVGYKLTLNGFYCAMENNGQLYKEGTSGANYIDNFRVTVNNNDAFKAGVQFADGASKIVFTEAVSNINAVSADNVTVTKNGRPLAVTSVKAISNSELLIEHGGYISDEDMYEIILPENLTSILGKSPVSNIVTNKATVETIKIKDIENKEAAFGETLPVDTKEISFAFDESVVKEELDKVFSITADGESAVYTTSYDEQNKIYTVTLTNCLKPNRSYTLSIADGAGVLPIEKTFTTGEGKISISKLAFYQGDTEITDLSKVTGEIELRAEIVNTTGEEKSYSLSYGVYNGAMMKDVDFVEGKIGVDEIKVTKSINVTVAKTGGNVIKGYIWDGITTMNPYTTAWAELK